MRRERREYTDEFRKQIVDLHASVKPKHELIKEYELTPSALTNWIKKYNQSGSFKAKDNRTEDEEKMLKLEKELKQLRMENDILKQAALIMGRK